MTAAEQVRTWPGTHTHLLAAKAGRFAASALWDRRPSCISIEPCLGSTCWPHDAHVRATALLARMNGECAGFRRVRQWHHAVRMLPCRWRCACRDGWPWCSSPCWCRIGRQQVHPLVCSRGMGEPPSRRGACLASVHGMEHELHCPQKVPRLASAHATCQLRSHGRARCSQRRGRDPCMQAAPSYARRCRLRLCRPQELELEEFRALESQIKSDVVGSRKQTAAKQEVRRPIPGRCTDAPFGTVPMDAPKAVLRCAAADWGRVSHRWHAHAVPTVSLGHPQASVCMLRGVCVSLLSPCR